MPWFKVDDSFSDHPKVRRIPRRQRAAVIGLWTLAGSWSAHHLTDGVIPAYMVEEFGCSPKDAATLVAVRLWDVAEDGWVFHNWMKWQPSKERVEAEREAAAERQRRARQRAAEARAARESQGTDASQSDTHHTEVTHPSRRDSRASNTASHASVTSPRPDPTRPDPVLPTEEPPPEVKRASSTPLRSVDADDPRFVEFWAAYPRREGKQAAAKAWSKALKIAAPEEITAGARRYAADPNRTDEYTCHPTTWLNRGSWDDEPLPSPASKPTARRAEREALFATWEANAAEIDNTQRQIGAS